MSQTNATVLAVEKTKNGKCYNISYKYKDWFDDEHTNTYFNVHESKIHGANLRPGSQIIIETSWCDGFRGIWVSNIDNPNDNESKHEFGDSCAASQLISYMPGDIYPDARVVTTLCKKYPGLMVRKNMTFSNTELSNNELVEAANRDLGQTKRNLYTLLCKNCEYNKK